MGVCGITDERLSVVVYTLIVGRAAADYTVEVICGLYMHVLTQNYTNTALKSQYWIGTGPSVFN